LLRFSLDTFASNKQFKKQVKDLFNYLIGLATDNELLSQIVGQYTQEDFTAMKEDSKFRESVYGRLDLIISAMGKEAGGMEEAFYSSMFDSKFYMTLINHYNKNTEDMRLFVDYLMVIIGFKEDDGTCLMEM
jgi:hypothetical protein